MNKLRLPAKELAALPLAFLLLVSSAAGQIDLARSARRAAAILKARQYPSGYWLTSVTDGIRFNRPSIELNTYLPAVMIDMLDPVAKPADLELTVERARKYLSSQIEESGLVRYHGRLDAPTIHALGCPITPDSDDTALVWRIAPGVRAEWLRSALATMKQYRTPDGLYRTWLAPRNRFQCIDPGKDPDPADVAIQMHIFMLLAKADAPAAAALCGALRRAIDDDRLWVYYKLAPLVPILRQRDLLQAGCALELPAARTRTHVSGQDIWISAAEMLARKQSVSPAVVKDLLTELAQDDFARIRLSPPLLYHNDMTASIRAFYWSREFGYALWLRLYFEFQH